jgi:predicted lipoprotein with Yx(FWY)xxD motif
VETTVYKNRGEIVRHHRSAIFAGAVALASFFAIGTGAAANASPTYGSGSNPSTATTVAPTSHIGNLTTVHAATTSVNGKFQSILVNAKGLPLYYFQGDTAKKSNVSGGLLRLWPALVSTHPVGTGTPGKLTALQSASGHQVTYNGRFLYTFIEDTPGHVTGQGVSGFFVATPHLKPVRSSITTAPAASSSGTHGYGY